MDADVQRNIERLNRKIQFLKALKGVCKTGAYTGVVVSAISFFNDPESINWVIPIIGTSATTCSVVVSKLLQNELYNTISEKSDIEYWYEYRNFKY